MDIFKKINLYQDEINKLRPFSGEMLNQIKSFYRIGITWSSNAIEGNSLTESETKILIEDGLSVGGKPLRDVYEALGHSDAYDYMFELMGNMGISEVDIKQLHKLFYKNIDSDYAGVYRDFPVFISGSNYPVTRVEDIQIDIERLCTWISEAYSLYHPVEFAALLHKKFVFIHPFKDGNGRVARLLMNTVLIQNGFLPVIIPPILRSVYISLLEKARADDRSFINFIAEMELNPKRIYLAFYKSNFRNEDKYLCLKILLVIFI